MNARDEHGEAWPAGVLYRDLTPEQQRAATRRAAARLQRELTAAAPAIAAVLASEQPDGAE